MNFLQKLASLFSSASRAGSPKYTLTAQCNRCGEIVAGEVNLYNDLSIDYNDHGEVSGYHCRKVLLGSGRCFQQIEIILTYDVARRLTNRQIAGGKFVEPSAS